MSLTVLLVFSAIHFLEKLTRAAMTFSDSDFLEFSEVEPPAAPLAAEAARALAFELRSLGESQRSCKILRNFAKKKREQICLREDDILEDLEKCCKMRTWTRKSALIQPRTRPGTSDGSSKRGGNAPRLSARFTRLKSGHS